MGSLESSGIVMFRGTRLKRFGRRARVFFASRHIEMPRADRVTMPRQELEIQHGPPSLAVSLPVELLSLIFELATEGNDASSAQRVRLRLARVCKPWRATISTGSYYVANSVKAAALANSLKRSDEIVDELHVTCEERSELNPGRSKAIADLLVTCAATVKRLTVRFEAIAGTRQDPVGSPIRNALAKCKQLQSLTWNWYAAVVLDVDLP